MGRKGFTTIELLVTTSILALVMGIGITVFLRHRNTAESSLSDKLVLQMGARRAADRIVQHLREGSEIIRPFLGETRNYLLYLDTLNQVTFVYLTEDPENSARFRRPLYRLISYVKDFAGGGFQPDREKVLASALQRVAFTLISPNSIQVTATVAGEKSEFQFVTHVGLQNFGGTQ